MHLTYAIDMFSLGALYNQALADARLTGVGIKCLYCTWVIGCIARSTVNNDTTTINVLDLFL